MKYQVSNDSDDVQLMFALKLMHMYNIENVYKVSRQVNDNILYKMDNVVRDPSVQTVSLLRQVTM